MEKQIKRPSFIIWSAMAAIIILLDQLSKFWIIQNLEFGDWLKITDFFNIVRAHNTGAAFSFLADAGGWQKWFFLSIGIIAVIFIVWQISKNSYDRVYCTSLSILGGGAIGNVIDRVIHGYVVDFLDFHWWGGAHFPAFNVADIAISTGAVLLIADELFRARNKSHQCKEG